MNGAADSVTLRGMTWDHPRGYDPMAACAAEWRRKTGVSIAWDKRSLQDFESYPISELAQAYDLIVIDHPHVGQVTVEGCLVPLDSAERRRQLDELERGSVGASFQSYQLQGHQWALPIDAAAQVQAWRPDRLQTPAAGWEEVFDLASTGLVLCPLKPPHSLMCFFTLCAHLGAPCQTSRGPLVMGDTWEEAYDCLRRLSAKAPTRCFAMDPIAVLEEMAQGNSEIACAPLIYGYASYARQGFRPARVSFADMPVADAKPPVGSALGGTGIAVSSLSSHPQEAADFAFWVANGDVQRGIYAAAGGQPGHADAWEADEVNLPVGDFCRQTRSTLEGAWVRPRHNGYMPFQHWAAERLNQALQTGEEPASMIASLNHAFEKSFEDVP